MEVFLTDDGCTDGTREMVLHDFPESHIIQGDGNLYWSRGMRMAWQEALKDDYDFYLWLNDDVVLYSNVFSELFACLDLQPNRVGIISGLIENREKTKILYGGSDRNKQLLLNSDMPQDIFHLNGNVVLVPREVIKNIGILDPYFWHDLGDVDYGMTARKTGIPVVTTRVPVGYGEENHICRVRKWNKTILGRFRDLYSPLGSPPRINFYFRRKHYSLTSASLYWVYLHFINLLPDSVYKFMKRQ